jgi:hypothetical protein
MLSKPQRMGVEQGAELSVSGGGVRHKGWECGWGDKPNSQSRGMADHWASLLDYGQHSKLNCPTFLGEELTSHCCSCRATQLQLDETNRLDHLAQTGNELPKVPICHLSYGQKEPNIAHKADIWWDQFRGSACNRRPTRSRKVGEKKNPPADSHTNSPTRRAASFSM